MSNDLLRFEDEYLARYYSKKQVNIVRGGYMQYVWDSNNNKYLDMHTGFGVAFLGHRNPRIINAIKDQLDKIITVH